MVGHVTQTQPKSVCATEDGCGEELLTDAEQKLWRAYLAVTKKLWEQLDMDLVESADLTLHEYEVLVRLSESPTNAMRMAELAELVFQSKSGFTHTAQRMERRGLVKRVKSSDDGRGRECVLTKQGAKLIDKCAMMHAASVRKRLFAPLTDVEREQLSDTLAKVCANMPVCDAECPEDC